MFLGFLRRARISGIKRAKIYGTRAEQHMVQEGSSPSDALMRGVVSKSGGNASLAGERGRYGDV
jgi:hypothetical protein